VRSNVDRDRVRESCAAEQVKKKSAAIVKRSTPLAKIRDLAAALAVCRNVDDVREIRNQAKAIETYIRARGLGVAQLADAAEVTLRAERRLGELCAALPKHPGNRAGADKKSAPPRLEDHGITQKQSSRWQQLARIDPNIFESALLESRDKQDRITVSGLIALTKPRAPGAKDDDVIDVDYPAQWLDEELEEHGWTITEKQRAAVIAYATTNGAPAALELLRAIAWSQWDTAPELAAKMVELAELGFEGRRDRVLEPSAGTGAIVKAIRAAAPKALITAHEIDPRRVQQLRTLVERGVIDHVVAGDFFEMAEYNPPEGQRAFDVSIQNTAYEGGADGRFLEHVMTLADRVVALLRTNALHGTDRYERVWSQCKSGGPWGVRDLVYLPSRPDFESIIADGTARSDFVVVRLDRGFSGETRLDWWLL
jgi:predicted RNA methylase